MSAQPDWYATQPAWYDESTAPPYGPEDGDDEEYLIDEDDDQDDVD